MARAMWSGVISFGMVTIPVKLHSATHSHNVAFHLLHAKCDTRIKEQRWCPYCDKQVDWDEITKGFEYTKGKYVELTDEDFEKLPLPSKHTIELSAFVEEKQIDPTFFDSTYYVNVDGKGAQKPYKLLMQVMQEKTLAAVATITFRNKEHVCALRAVNGLLVLQTLLYRDEIDLNESEKPSSVKITAQEKKMAESLVAALRGNFEPSKFKDKYQSALKKLIDAKLKGKEIKESLPAEPTQVTDLMEALRASVANAKKPTRAAKGKPVKEKKATAKTEENQSCLSIWGSRINRAKLLASGSRRARVT